MLLLICITHRSNKRPSIEPYLLVPFCTARSAKASFKDAQMQRIESWGAALDHCDLDGANLQGAQLECASFRLANLDGANLQQANVAGADLSFACLRGADLRDVQFYEDVPRERKLRFDMKMGLQEANLTAADFTGVRNLTASQLTQSQARQIKFLPHYLQPPEHQSWAVPSVMNNQ